VIRDANSAEMNDATSTKQNVNDTTGIVVQANNATTDFYWHMQESLGTPITSPGGPAPTTSRHRPRLRITAKRWRHRRLYVVGTLARGASGKVTVRYLTRLHGRRIRAHRSTKVKRGRFSVLLRVPRRVVGRRATLWAHYGGDASYLPATARARLRRAR
jgi:hypothetical protein